MQTLSSKYDIPSPNSATVSSMCALADFVPDTDAGFCAIELAKVIDEILGTVTPVQKRILLRGGAHLIRSFRRQHPEMDTGPLNNDLSVLSTSAAPARG